MGKLEEIEARLAARMAEIDKKLGIGGAQSDADTREMRGREPYHLYCDKCGYEWYSSNWDNYCPRSGCTGHAHRYALPQANIGANAARTVLPNAGKRKPASAKAMMEATASRAKTILPDGLSGDLDNPALWETTVEELNQLMGYVKSSPHVASNALYSQIAPTLVFKVVDDPTINAYATIENGAPTIYILSGAIRYANLVSAAYTLACVDAKENGGKSEFMPEFIEAFATCLESFGYSLTPENAAMVGSCGIGYVMMIPEMQRKATSFAAGLIIGILAHEYGHLALGHLYGASQTLEISRNQEREADSFASSVISSSPFGDYAVAGSILWELAWVWQEKHDPQGAVATTHPLASERLTDLIRANPSSAAEFGLIFVEGAAVLPEKDMVAISRRASAALPGNVKYDWTSGVICGWGCQGECNGN